MHLVKPWHMEAMQSHLDEEHKAQMKAQRG